MVRIALSSMELRVSHNPFSWPESGFFYILQIDYISGRFLRLEFLIFALQPCHEVKDLGVNIIMNILYAAASYIYIILQFLNKLLVIYVLAAPLRRSLIFH